MFINVEQMVDSSSCTVTFTKNSSGENREYLKNLAFRIIESFGEIMGELFTEEDTERVVVTVGKEGIVV